MAGDVPGVAVARGDRLHAGRDVRAVIRLGEGEASGHREGRDRRFEARDLFGASALADHGAEHADLTAVEGGDGCVEALELEVLEPVVVRARRAVRVEQGGVVLEPQFRQLVSEVRGGFARLPPLGHVRACAPFEQFAQRSQLLALGFGEQIGGVTEEVRCRTSADGRGKRFTHL